MEKRTKGTKERRLKKRLRRLNRRELRLYHFARQTDALWDGSLWRELRLIARRRNRLIETIDQQVWRSYTTWLVSVGW